MSEFPETKALLLAKLLQDPVIGTAACSENCGCNEVCGCKKDSCCEAKCKCDGKTSAADIFPPDALVDDERFKELTREFGESEIRTISDFQALAARLKTRFEAQ